MLTNVNRITSSLVKLFRNYLQNRHEQPLVYITIDNTYEITGKTTLLSLARHIMAVNFITKL